MLDLVIGGARSGKTSVAERLALQAGRPVAYVATSIVGDDEYRARIEAHRHRRPADWLVVEEPRRVAEAVSALPGRTIIVDCLGMLVTNLLFANAPIRDELAGETVDPRKATGGGVATGGGGDGVPPGVDLTPVSTEQVLARVAGLAAAALKHDGLVIIVSNEVGQGLVPEYELGRAFRDLLGEANQIIARNADRVFLTVAGIPVDIKAISPLTLRDALLPPAGRPVE